MIEHSTLNPGQSHISQAQIDSLAGQHFINSIDHHLRIISSIEIEQQATSAPVSVILIIEIYYDNQYSGRLSFNLHNYDYEEILTIAKNIRKNEFILHEVDNFLSGDVGE